MTKKDYEMIADMVAEMAIASVPIYHQQSLLPDHVVGLARLEANARIAYRRLKAQNERCDWAKFHKAVQTSALSQIVAKQAKD